MNLRLGPGETFPKQEGWLNIDIRELPDIDVVTDVMKMPFADGEHDHIESRNLVEHFGRHEIDDLFQEWARVLKPGGTFSIETVDMGETMTHWKEIPFDNLLDAALGAQTYPENFHKMLFTQETLTEALNKAGLLVDGVKSFVEREIPRMIMLGHKA
jgi:predicted SAM-dependent methyltransferase